MAMPKFVVNIMDGMETESLAVWMVVVGQLKAEFERLDQPTTNWGEEVIQEVLDCCEAFARLDINAMNLELDDYEQIGHWQDLTGLQDSVTASAFQFDKNFLRKQKLRLEEKGLE